MQTEMETLIHNVASLTNKLQAANEEQKQDVFLELQEAFAELETAIYSIDETTEDAEEETEAAIEQVADEEPSKEKAKEPSPTQPVTPLNNVLTTAESATENPQEEAASNDDEETTSRRRRGNAS